MKRLLLYAAVLLVWIAVLIYLPTACERAPEACSDLLMAGGVR